MSQDWNNPVLRSRLKDDYVFRAWQLTYLQRIAEAQEKLVTAHGYAPWMELNENEEEGV